MYTLGENFFEISEDHKNLANFFKKNNPSFEDAEDLTDLYDNETKVYNDKGEPIVGTCESIHYLVVAIIKQSLPHFRVLLQKFEKDYNFSLPQYHIIATVKDCIQTLQLNDFLRELDAHPVIFNIGISSSMSPRISSFPYNVEAPFDASTPSELPQMREALENASLPPLLTPTISSFFSQTSSVRTSVRTSPMHGPASLFDNFSL